MPGAAARCARVDLSAGRATRSPSRVERRAFLSRSRVASRTIRSPRPVGRPGDALAFARGYPDASLAFAGGQPRDALAFARGYPDASLTFAGGQAGDALAFETVARVATGACRQQSARDAGRGWPAGRFARRGLSAGRATRSPSRVAIRTLRSRARVARRAMRSRSRRSRALQPARVGSKARGTPVAGVSPCRSAVHNGRATLAKMLSSAVRWIV